jgi:hypothetical protein
MIVFNRGVDFPLLLLGFILCIKLTASAFVATEGCSLISDNFGLEHFVIDVALDKKDKKLKFLMNSKVIEGCPYFEWDSDDVDTGYPQKNTTKSRKPVITDVNTTTNMFTTFHVEIDFMGKTFIKRDMRFCDMIMVKNDSSFRSSPRFQTSSVAPASATHIPAPERLNFSGHSRNSRSESEIDPAFGLSKRVDEINLSHFGIEGTFGLKLARPDTFLPSSFKADPSLRFFTLDGKRDTIPTDRTVIRKKYDTFGQSNSTIESLFSNSTGSLVQCPLYINDSFVLYFEADISDHFNRLGSYLVRFSIIPNDLTSLTVGCKRIYVTPVQERNISFTILVGIIVLLVVTGIVNIFTIVYSSYQESSNPFLFTASTVCNENLLKQLDATVPRIIMYLQFALFAGGLDLQYPGFFQPLIGQFRWCALLGYPVINKQGFRSVGLDNIYRTLNTGGLKSLTVYFSNQFSVQLNWPNFMLCLLIWILVLIFLQQLFLFIKHLVDRARKGNNDYFQFTRQKNLYLIGGQVLSNFFVIFAVPFVVLTVYMLSDAGRFNSHHIFFPDLSTLRKNAFSANASYDSLLDPTAYIANNKLNHAYKLNHDYKLNQYNSTHTSSIDSSFLGNLTHLISPNGTRNELPNGIVVRDFTRIPIVSIVFGSVLLFAWVAMVLYFTFSYLITIKNKRITTSNNVAKLYTSMKTILLWGFLYHQYHPQRVFYVIYYFLNVLIKLSIIGGLQLNGLVQVACLIIIEASDIATLLIVRPYFVNLSWRSSIWMLPLARLLVTLLCIGYIRELGFSEVSRTYVAYTQLVIHLVVAVVFIIQLAYCFVITVLSIIKTHRERKQYAKYSNKLGNVNSLDDFVKEFEYHPVGYTGKVLPREDMNQLVSQNHQLISQNHTFISDQKNKFISESKELPSKDSNSLLLENQFNSYPKIDIDLDNEEEEVEDLYYRAKSELQLKKVSSPPSEPKETYCGKEYFDCESTPREDASSAILSLSDFQTFKEQQKFSNLRKITSDYRVREGDRIYNKYFIDDSIDPEVKALWDSRNNWGENRKSRSSHTSQPPTKFQEGLLGKFTWLWKATKSNLGENGGNGGNGENGFQVLRPRPLIVRPLPIAQDSFNSESPPSLASCKSNLSIDDTCSEKI